MVEKIFIVPGKPGLRVEDPETGKTLDAAGEYKPGNPYWKRRLSGGDVIVATPPVNKPAKGDVTAAAPSDKTDTTAKKDKVNKL